MLNEQIRILLEFDKIGAGMDFPNVGLVIQYPVLWFDHCAMGTEEREGHLLKRSYSNRTHPDGKFDVRRSKLKNSKSTQI